MSQYIFAYHGGKAPETDSQRQQVMTQWNSWFEDLGDAVVNGGNPVGHSTTVKSSGDVVDNGGSNPLMGYSFIKADSLDEAIDMGKTCPILTAGGSIEVAPVVNMH